MGEMRSRQTVLIDFRSFWILKAIWRDGLRRLDRLTQMGCDATSFCTYPEPSVAEQLLRSCAWQADRRGSGGATTVAAHGTQPLGMLHDTWITQAQPSFCMAMKPRVIVRSLERGFLAVDGMRRAQGAVLDSCGLGPIETPWRELARNDGMQLRGYAGLRRGPALLLVPAPIKRAYIWDLAPRRSVVRQGLAAGYNIALLEWTEPEAGSSADRGLDDYADRLIGAALAAASAAFGTEGMLLAGHSLGGTLAAIFASLHPERVRGLALIEAPLHFGPDTGALGLLAAAPWAAEAATAFEAVPGSLISALGLTVDPVEFIAERWLDALASAADPEAAANHLRVLRWTFDEFAMPTRLFADVLGRLCRDDEFHLGKLTIGGCAARPDRLGMPLLTVLDRRSMLVPARAVLPALQRASGPLTIHWHEEAAAGAALKHVGALVGREAHRRLWPKLLDQLAAVWEGRPLPR
jgi:poly[(R)-3-hydroxyalkanoate] polymerase subunit PhaC